MTLGHALLPSAWVRNDSGPPSLRWHLEDDTSDEYALRRLSEDQLREVEEYLSVCESYRGRLTQTQDFIRTFRQALQDPVD